MKNFKNALLVVAAASLLTACGGDETSSSEGNLEPGASVMGGVVIDYTSDANLMSASVFGDFNGGFMYTPHENTKIQIVPTFVGKNTLSHAEINGQRYEPTVSEDFKVKTFMGELDLSGIPFIEYTMTSAVPNVKLFSKATEGTTHKVTLNIDDKTTGYELYDSIEDTWTNITGSEIDSYFGKAGTHTVEVLDGAAAGFLIQGADLERYHEGYFGYSIQAEGTTIAWNTLEASIDNTMKTAAIWKMPAKDLTVNISMSNAATTGKAYDLVNVREGVGKATASYTVDYHGDATLRTITLDEYNLPQYVTVTDTAGLDETDYVVGNIKGWSGPTEQKWYKTIQFGEYTLTATLGTLEGEEGSNWLSYVDAEGKNPFTKAEACEAWAEAVEADNVIVKLKGGDKKFGNKEYNKEVNGYGTTGAKFDWHMNRNATVGMVMDFGIEASLAAKQKDGKGPFYIIDENGEEIETGATWTNHNKDFSSEGFSSYVHLIKAAIDAAEAQLKK